MYLERVKTNDITIHAWKNIRWSYLFKVSNHIWRLKLLWSLVAWVRGDKCPISNNNGSKRAATRNTTNNTTTVAGTTNEYSEYDPDNKDYVAHLLRKKLKTDAPKKTKKKTLYGKDKNKKTKEQNKNK